MFTGFRVQGSGLRVQGVRVMGVPQGHIGNARMVGVPLRLDRDFFETPHMRLDVYEKATLLPTS